MPTLRASLVTLLVVAGAVAAAALGAFAVRQAGATPPIVPGVAVLVVVGIFVWRVREGLLAFVVFALFADTLELWLGLDLLLFDELGLLLLGAAAVATRRISLARLRLGWPGVGMAILAGAAVLSSLVNGVPLVLWTSGLLLLFKGIGFFALVRLLPLSLRDATQMGLAVVILGVAIGALGFVELLDPVAFQRALGLPPFASERAEVPVVRAIFLHPALYGWLTAFVSLLLYARVMTHGTWWLLPIAAAMDLGSIISGRRTPLLGVAAALAVGLAWLTWRLGLRRAGPRVWLPAAGALIVVVAVLAPWAARMVEDTRTEYGPSLAAAAELFAEEPRGEVVATLHPRVALYAGSVAIARDRLPFGAGVGRFGSHLSRDQYSPVYAEYGLDAVRLLGPEDPQAATDAYWPMILGETGVIGLAGAVLFFAAVAVGLWQRASQADSPAGRMVALAALLVFTEGIVRSFTSSVFVAPPIAYFVLGAAGVAYATVQTIDGAGQGPEGPATP